VLGVDALPWATRIRSVSPRRNFGPKHDALADRLPSAARAQRQHNMSASVLLGRRVAVGQDYPQPVAGTASEEAVKVVIRCSTLMNVAPEVTQQVAQIALISPSRSKVLDLAASIGRS
jgi:predicted ArsR family transcriptional regulator